MSYFLKMQTASSYMGKYLRISSYIRKPFLIYDFATAPFWISTRKNSIFFFISVQQHYLLIGQKIFIKCFVHVCHTKSTPAKRGDKDTDSFSNFFFTNPRCFFSRCDLFLGLARESFRQWSVHCYKKWANKAWFLALSFLTDSSGILFIAVNFSFSWLNNG
jgi:hypothetical protein